MRWANAKFMAIRSPKGLEKKSGAAGADRDVDDQRRCGRARWCCRPRRLSDGYLDAKRGASADRQLALFRHLGGLVAKRAVGLVDARNEFGTARMARYC